MAKRKERLDKLLVERGLVATRAKAQAHVMAGEVRVNEEVVTKAGMKISADARIELINQMPYVSRGGYKLAGALEQFGIDLTGAICADVGACTGGFTDVMLQNGAARVHAIDVGYGQLDWKLRSDVRVVVIERTNARYLETLGETVSFVSIDTSFISLKLILPAVKNWLPDTNAYNIVALIKPQFEAGKSQVGSGGIVRDPDVHRAVLKDILGWCLQNELYPAGLTRSSIEGSDGNVEFLVWLRGSDSGFDVEHTIFALIGAAEETL
jgi:23S rRNA (cytidine1920-2'-O)/16S rRNA (cytidine1409-2'-O)-methyltransferase